MKWSFVGRVLVVCSSGGRLVDEVFSPILKDIRSTPIDSCVALSLGTPQMTSVQRKQAALVVKERKFRPVVLTDNPVTRGVVTAISWFGADISSHALADMDRALDALGVQGERRTKVRACADLLRREVERELRLQHAG